VLEGDLNYLQGPHIFEGDLLLLLGPLNPEPHSPWSCASATSLESCPCLVDFAALRTSP
jgi:hypothetical protein